MVELTGFQPFESREVASLAAADLLAGLLRDTLDDNPLAGASLVVSGGSTPGPCFAQLSTESLDWPRVTVVPSDERWVPPRNPASNELLIRRQLIRNKAGRAQLLPFFRAGIEAVQAPKMIERDLQAVPQPFSATLLGMGEDGHFASLFPDFSGLPGALDPGGEARCVMVQTGASPHPRISLTLSALLDSRAIILLIFGQAKRRVIEAAYQADSAYPVEALLRHAGCPLHVLWAP
jgi:6-phosphogluconolactonase